MRTLAERDIALTALLLLLATGSHALADEEPEAVTDELPDMALLEYLGSWDGEDEDWLLFEDDLEARSEPDDTRSDPAGRSQESQESEHEG